MRRLLVIAVALGLVLAACSSDGPLAVEIVHDMQPPQHPFTASGAAVDEGLVCGAGVFMEAPMENLAGDPIEFEEWVQLFDAAVESRGVAEAIDHKHLDCGDGSGSITVIEHVRIDFASGDWGSGKWETGTWTVTGTEAYDSLSGSGTITTDFTNMQIRIVGEVTG